MNLAILTDQPTEQLILASIFVLGAGLFAIGGIVLLSTWLTNRFYRNHK